MSHFSIGPPTCPIVTKKVLGHPQTPPEDSMSSLEASHLHLEEWACPLPEICGLCSPNLASFEYTFSPLLPSSRLEPHLENYLSDVGTKGLTPYQPNPLTLYLRIFSES